MSFDLADILRGVQSTSGDIEQFKQYALANNKAVTAITDGLAADAKAAGEAASTIEEAKQQATREQERTRLMIANRMGTNANDVGWVAGNMADRVKEADAKMQQKIAEIEAKQKINFIDNPLGYIYAQATVDGDIAEHNAASRQKDLASQTAQQLERMTSESFQNNTALTQTITDSTIGAGKILAAHKFNAEAGEAALQGLRSNLQGMQAAMQASQAQIQLQFAGHNAVMQEKNYAIAAAGLAMRREEFNLAKEAKLAKLSEDQFVLDRASQGYFALTGNQMPDVQKKDIVMLYRSGQPQVAAWVNSGLASYMTDPAGSKPIVSNSVFDASTMYAQGDVKNLPTSQKQVFDHILDLRTAWQKTPGGMEAMASKDKGAAERAFNAFAAASAKQEQANVQPGSIYSIPNLADIAKANPNVAALPAWQTVLAPLAASGAQLDNPTFVVGSLMSAMKSGKLTYDQTVDGISTIYGAGVSLNNQARNFITAGLPPAFSYGVKIRAPGQIGKIEFNAADKKSVATALNKYAAEQAMLTIGLAAQMP